MNEIADSSAANEEQVLYAKILATGMYVGLGSLLVTFTLYTFGIIAPAIPLDELDKYWHMDVQCCLEAVEKDHLGQGHLITGWTWVRLLDKGDYLNFLGIAILSLVTIVCYVAIIPTLMRKNDRLYAIMAFIEVVVLLLAASGLLAAGH